MDLERAAYSSGGDNSAGRTHGNDRQAVLPYSITQQFRAKPLTPHKKNSHWLRDGSGPLASRRSAPLAVATLPWPSRTGRWPSAASGAVLDAPDENWQAIDMVLRCGSRGLPAGLSLPRLPSFLGGSPWVEEGAGVGDRRDRDYLTSLRRRSCRQSSEGGPQSILCLGGPLQPDQEAEHGLGGPVQGVSPAILT
jgi:hypothetical protein